MNYVVQFSGGIGSFAATHYLINKLSIPRQLITLLFCDTKSEDYDLYRFLRDTSKFLDIPVTVIADGRDIWQVMKDKRIIGNSRRDPCSHFLKREVARKYMESNFPAFYNTTMVFGIDWTESHRRVSIEGRWGPYPCLFPLCDDTGYDKLKFMEKTEKEFGIALPRLYALGSPHNNCFSGDTEFITSDGLKTLEACVGDEIEVIGPRGNFVPATVLSFGIQPTVKMVIARNGKTQTIITTESHRWFIRHNRKNRLERTTSTLKPGDRLWGTYSQLQTNVRPSAFSIAQGIVYGDGTRPDNNSPARIMLCGEKVELLKYFPLSPLSEAPVGVEVKDLPRTWKDLPTFNESKSFLYGWLAGYFAADGSVHCGEVSISSSNIVNLKFVEGVCAKLGIATHEIRNHPRVGYGVEESDLYTLPMVAGTIRDEFFIRLKHFQRFTDSSENRPRPNEWKFVSMESNGKQEVFCAVVPGDHAFVLKGNILTGNCGGMCVKSGKAAFLNALDTLPELYHEWETKEQEMRDYLQKPYTIIMEAKTFRDIITAVNFMQEYAHRSPRLYYLAEDKRTWIKVDGDNWFNYPSTATKFQVKTYLTLRELRERAEEIRQTPEGKEDFGGCACFA